MATKKATKENANLDEFIKFLKAEDEIVSNDIISAVTPDYEKICATGYISSVKVPSNDGYMITVTNKHQYSAITPTEEGNIKNIVGDENYDHWFIKKNEIKVKENANLDELIKLVGVEKFKEMFTVTQNIVPTTSFTEEKYRRLTSEKRVVLNNTVRQYKPTIRTK